METAKRDPTAVERAVEAVGGPTKAAHACGVSNAAIYQWFDLGHVPRSRYAVLLAEASGVPVRELAGLPPLRDPDGLPTVGERTGSSRTATGTLEANGEDDAEADAAASVSALGRRRCYAAPAVRKRRRRPANIQDYDAMPLWPLAA